MIKAIIFDADGVLINGEMFSRRYQKEFGIGNDSMLKFFKGKFQDCLVGEADLKVEIRKHLAKWKWTKTVDEFLEYWFAAEHSINQDLVDYIKHLRESGVICCLGTNQEKYRTEYMLKQMGFKNIFDHVFSSAHMGYRKPQEEFFKIAVDRLHLSKDEVLLWDDTLEHIEAAKRFGIHAKFYSSFEEFKKVMKGYIL